MKAIVVEFDAPGRRTEPLSAPQCCTHTPIRVGQEAEGGRADRMGQQAPAEVMKERLEALSSYPWSSYLSYILGTGPGWLQDRKKVPTDFRAQSV